MLQSLPGSFDWYACLTGNTYLAQSATITLELIGLFDILSRANQVLSTLLLVVALLGNRTDRAAINTFTASPIGKKEAIGPVIGIGPGRWFDGYFGHHRSNPHGFAPRSDQPITQTESAQTGCVGRMAFRPGRGVRKARRIDDGPVGNEHWRDGGMAGLFKTLGHVATQGDIERFAIDPDPGPFLGRILPGPAIGLANSLSLGQHP